MKAPNRWVIRRFISRPRHDYSFMPITDQDSDTTESDYPRDSENPFQGRSHNPSENGETTGEGEQRQGADTTANADAEPADNGQDPSTTDQTPEHGDEADTTAQEPSAGDETDPEATAEGEEVEAEGEEEPDAGREDSGEPDDDTTDEKPFKYHGTEPEDEEHEDYVFISEVDPDQRYEDVDDFVNAHEELLSHTRRQQQQLEQTREQLANARAEKEGEVEELRTKLSLYEEHLDGDDITAAIAERFMPEDFQGVSEEDVPDSRMKEYYKARAEAEHKAEQQLEEAEEAREQTKQSVQEQRQALQDRFEEGENRLESVDFDRLGLDGPEDKEYLVEALNEFQIGEGEDAKNALDIAFDVFSIAPLIPEEVGVDEQEVDMAFDLIVDAVGAKARQIKAEKAQERASKIKRKAEPTQRKRGEGGEQATQESARREPGNPFETFKNAG